VARSGLNGGLRSEEAKLRTLAFSAKSVLKKSFLGINYILEMR